MTNVKRPNIIFLSVDELSYSALSAHGCEDVKTPNMDRLLALGVDFSRAYTTCPLCSPARASLATGFYPSENGVEFNTSPLRREYPDIGQLMTQAGYNAVHCGKWHVPGRDVRTSFDCLYYGNDVINACGAEVFDSVTLHAALAFLAKYDSSAPFYLQVGLINPHDICEFLYGFEGKQVPDLSSLNMDLLVKLPSLPDNFDAQSGETRLMRLLRRSPDYLMHTGVAKALAGWAKAQWQVYLWQYYRYVEVVDAAIGRLITALESMPFCDNTVLVFSSDHGESMGGHGLFQKLTLYEESVHVPLAVADYTGRYVEKKGTVCDRLISGVDIFGTICQLAGIPHGTQAKSILPQAGAPFEAPREYVYIECNHWGRAIVDKQYKLIVDYIPTGNGDGMVPRSNTHGFGDIALYDIQNDKGETRDIAAHLPARTNEMLHRLRSHEENMATPPITDGRTLKDIALWEGALKKAYERE